MVDLMVALLDEPLDDQTVVSSDATKVVKSETRSGNELGDVWEDMLGRMLVHL